MCFQCENKSGEGQPNTVKFNAPLDKLEQGGKNDTDRFEKNLSKSGYDRDRLTKRARRKYFSKSLGYALVNASRSDEYDSLEYQYWQTVRCGEIVHFDGMDTKSSYCGKRWCTICNSIRTGQLISKYQPTIDTWKNKQFVTLTRKAVAGEKIRATIDEMTKELRKIRDVAKKRFKAGKLEHKPVAIVKIECNYNPKKNTYNPHFHIITSTEEFAVMLRDEWIKRYEKMSVQLGFSKDMLVRPIAQKIVEADSNTSKELFKYFAKLTVSVKKKNGKKKHEVYADALNVIFRAIKRKRTLFHFGFKQDKTLDEIEVDGELEVETMAEIVSEETGHTEEKANPAPGHYMWEKSDWLHVDTGEALTGYKPSERFTKFIESGIKFTDGIRRKIPDKPDWLDRHKPNIIPPGESKTPEKKPTRSCSTPDGESDGGKKMFPSELYFEGDEYSNLISNIKNRKNVKK